ncbi:MAG: hypothetical protein ACFFDI_11955 [Promethearchaeota archaeon]
MKRSKLLLLLFSLTLFMGTLFVSPLISTSSFASDYQEDNTPISFNPEGEMFVDIDITNDNNDDDSDDDSSDDETEDEEESESHDRELEMKVEADSAEIKSILAQGERKDKIEFKIETSDIIRMVLKYSPEFSSESNSTEVESEIELQFAIKFEEIIEYFDDGTAGNGYQQGEEISNYEVGQSGWQDLAYSLTSINETKVHVIQAITNDNVFTATLRLTEDVLAFPNSTLTPNSVKIDITIDKFPYASDSSSLALKTKVETGASQEIKEETLEEEEGFGENETEVRLDVDTDTLASLGINNITGFFSWAETALVDDQIINVLSSSLVDSSDDHDDDLEEGESSYTMYFSFIATHPEKIIWDPKIGVLSIDFLNVIPQVAFTPGFEFGIIFVVLGLLFALNGFLRFKKRSLT